MALLKVIFVLSLALSSVSSLAVETDERVAVPAALVTDGNPFSPTELIQWARTTFPERSEDTDEATLKWLNHMETYGPDPGLKSRVFRRDVPLLTSEELYGKMRKAELYASALNCPESLIATWNCTSCREKDIADSEMLDYFNFTTTDTVGYMAFEPSTRTLTIAFGGSKTLLNAAMDLQFLHHALPWPEVPTEAHVHAGFWASYAVAEDHIRRTVSRLIRAKRPDRIQVVGHSLGGALAVLCALDLQLHVLPVVDASAYIDLEVFTSGQPRVGNHEFVAFFRSVIHIERYHRLVHQNDPVPHLPPRAFSYEHIGSEFWIVPVTDATQVARLQAAGAVMFEDATEPGKWLKTTVCSFLMNEDPTCSASLGLSHLKLKYHGYAWDARYASSACV